MAAKKTTISIVVPVFNEAQAIEILHKNILKSLASLASFAPEIVYVNDGSTDETLKHLESLRKENTFVKIISLSRNFGKENALSAGLALSRGDIVISLDGDGQHPPELIKSFVKKWQNGASVVIGVRTKTEGLGFIKNLTSFIFYKMFNLVAEQKLVPGSTDYRLLDRAVVSEFLKLTESDRITRGLIDWLGFNPEYLYFTAKSRIGGKETYSLKKLAQLGMNSFVSLSPAPLYVFGYVGMLIAFVSGLLGSVILVEQLLLNDPLGWNFTGTAMLGVLIIFLVGLVLISQGVISLYISHIHNQTKRRPLYVIDFKNSAGIKIEKK